MPFMNYQGARTVVPKQPGESRLSGSEWVAKYFIANLDPEIRKQYRTLSEDDVSALLYSIAIGKGDKFGSSWLPALLAECNWFRERRPYFNIHPMIEKAAENLPDLATIPPPPRRLPDTLEVRTETHAFLLQHDVIKDTGPVHQYFINPSFDIDETVDFNSGRNSHSMIYFDTTDNLGSVLERLTKHIEPIVIRLAFAVAMVADDEQIVTPSILNCDRNKPWSAKLAERATKRSGRVGFDVGKASHPGRSEHYRRGCFAHYRVGPTHEKYPLGCKTDKASVLIYRRGGRVKGKKVKVPTGYHGE